MYFCVTLYLTSLSIYKHWLNLVTMNHCILQREKGSTIHDLSCYSEPTAKMGEETRLSDAHLHIPINKAFPKIHRLSSSFKISMPSHQPVFNRWLHKFYCLIRLCQQSMNYSAWHTGPSSNLQSPQGSPRWTTTLCPSSSLFPIYTGKITILAESPPHRQHEKLESTEKMTTTVNQVNS